MVTLSCCYSTNYTPSVSLAGSEVPSSLPAPPPGSRGIVRICPRFHKTVGACRETLLRLAKSRLTAVARLHSACASLSQPLWAASSPIGEPRASLPPLGVVRRTALAAPFGGGAPRSPRCPLWGKCREAAKGVSLVTLSCYHSTNDTPSVSLCSTAPPPGSQGILLFGGGKEKSIY